MGCVTKWLLAAGALLALTALSGCGGNGSKKLSGSGSTFIKPVMDKWIAEYDKEKSGVEINYQGQGSTAGIRQTTEKAVHFGCTDAVLTAEQRQDAEREGGEMIHIPLVMGGVVPAYNLPGVDKPLNFSGEVLADIFYGDITRWNDPRIQADNKDIQLPDLKISVVHRAEGSGTTAIFTEFLSTVSPKWKNKAGTTIDWPVGSGEKGNPAVADNIGRSAGSIGYVELLYALQKKDKIKYGAVRNKAGKFIRADLPSVRAAAASLKTVPDDLCFSLVKDYDGPDAYPICGTTWAVLYRDQSGDAGHELVKFLTWVVHDGQKYAEQMHYVPLPESLVRRIDEKLKTIIVDRGS